MNVRPTSLSTRVDASLALVAAAGLMTGLSGCDKNEPKGDAAAASSSSSSSASSANCCVGKNDCKGKGGCKTAKNACAGNNDCKGKGGCQHRECP